MLPPLVKNSLKLLQDRMQVILGKFNWGIDYNKFNRVMGVFD